MGSLVAELAEKLSSATNNLDFDEQTLFLNTSADTVGIGTNAPASKLDVRGTMQVGVDGTGHDVIFYGDTAGSKMTWSQAADALYLTDDTKLRIGDSQDLTIYHDGTNSFIKNETGIMNLCTDVSGIAVKIGHTTSHTTINHNATITGTLTQTGIATFAAIPVFSAGINVSGGTIAGTLATAAQANITSLGTLTGLTVNGAVVFNENSANDIDFRVEGATNANLLMVDGSTDRVGIGTATPASTLHVNGAITSNDLILNNLEKDEPNMFDGTKGHWHIQEGSDNLFIMNHVTGKKYKFNLTEIS